MGYKVEGKLDGFYVTRKYKTRKRALLLAGKLEESEVYHEEEKQYIYGKSKFYKNIIKAENAMKGK